MKKIPIVACILALAILFGCKREERRFREPTPSSTASNAITMSGLHPANPTQGTVPPDWPVNNAYEESADAVSQGQKLFDQYNCSGCHAHGGGGIGPPLMDKNWIYGSEPQKIFFHHHARPSQRHAVVPQPCSRVPGVANRSICAINERFASERCRTRAQR